MRLVFGEGAEVGFRGAWCEQADGDEADETGEECGEDGVAVGENGGEVGVDEGAIPEDGDKGPGEDAGNGSGGGGAAPVERGEDDRGERSGVDGVGVEGFLKDGLCVQALIERPEAEQDDHRAGDEEDFFVRGAGLEVADEEVVDQVGGGGEEIVVGGGDDLGEDGPDEQRAEELEKKRCRSVVVPHICAEGVQTGVGEDLAGMVVYFASGEDGGACDG